MPALRHTLISASAGSGKTYQLVRRYLHLLAMGEKPSRITAVTFTRKAAGEFVNRILRRLSELAEDQQQAREFVQELGIPKDHEVNFASVLKEVIRELPRLRLGTIDSFFATVAACFPLELGQPVGASVMAEEETKRAKTEVITQLLSRLYREHDRNAASVLLEAFKQATFGNEEKRVLDTLTEWLGKGHELWHECSDANRWGQPDAVWPRPKHDDAAIWQAGSSVREAWDELAAAFDVSTLKDKRAQAAWLLIQDQVATLRLGQKPPAQLTSFIERLNLIRDGLASGDGTMKYQYSEWNFQGTAAKAALAFLNTVVGHELRTRCQRTQGIRQVIQAYDEDYERTVRSRGRLSFADLTRLLATAQGDGSWVDDGARGDLWYRIDGKVDHWLFDEFQDTSAQQWSIMRNLVDEVLQDSDRRRTFFAVGDVKQSIYLWRKAEPQLFKHVLHAYRDDGENGIVSDTLAQSWRSSKHVLDLVNGVFGDREKLVEMLGERCLTHWTFEPHTAARNIVGVGAFLQPAEAEEGDEKAGEEAVAAALLRQLQPTQRGLSCAVLVRSNNSAIEMTEYLREHTGLDVLSQSEEYPAEDNPATSAVLAALQLAAHPGDKLALEHLRMTPLAALFADDHDWRIRVNDTLRLVQDEGMGAGIEYWAEAMSELSLDVFSQRRMERLADIAAEFDESGSRDVNAFLDFARSYGVRSGAAESAVQVMTVHKSKGLEFDIVLVPVSEKTSLASADAKGLVLKRNGLEPVDWVLQFPTQPYADIDEVLAAQKQAMDEEAGFESLCRLYVAMTRAKRALYVIAPQPPKKAGAVNAAHLLRQTLGDEPTPEMIEGVGVEWLRVLGDTQWFAGIKPETKAEPEVPLRSEPLSVVLRAHQPMPKRSTPSGEESFVVKGSVIFSPGRESGRNLGTLLHLLMEQVEWLRDEADEVAVVERWKHCKLDAQPGFEPAQEMALKVIRSLSCRSAFTPSDARSKVWRERPFDLVKADGEWISGTVDRVVVDYDASGRPQAATIIDYKTDDVQDDAALNEKLKGYQPQIALYRQAVAALTGLPMQAVSASLLFARSARLVAMP